MELIKNNEVLLRQPCQNIKLQEGLKLGNQLLKFLQKYNKDHKTKGIGLSAPQVGIFKKVCVVNVRDPIILVNPVILEEGSKIEFEEGCLSFPGIYLKTSRSNWIRLKSDNFGERIYGLYGVKYKEALSSNLLLECVALQHEISHVYSGLFFDYEVK